REWGLLHRGRSHYRGTLQDPFGRALSESVHSHVLIATARSISGTSLARIALISHTPALVRRNRDLENPSTLRSCWPGGDRWRACLEGCSRSFLRVGTSTVGVAAQAWF